MKVWMILRHCTDDCTYSAAETHSIWTDEAKCRGALARREQLEPSYEYMWWTMEEMETDKDN